MRGGPLTQKPSDGNNSKDACVVDVFTVETECEPGTSALPHEKVLMPPVWTADLGSSSHITQNQRGDIDIRPLKNRAVVTAGGDEVLVRGVGKVNFILHSEGKAVRVTDSG